jgi:hypothetical protein
MDAGLASWLDEGLYFDYLGFDIFYRVEGSGPPLLLIHGYHSIPLTGNRFGRR